MISLKSILVTGGAGFIGSNFVRHMLASHAVEKIIALDLLTYAGSRNNLHNLPNTDRHTFIEGDIADSRLVRRLLVEYDIDAVVHFAAESHVDRSINGPAAFIQTNIVGTFALLEACRDVWQARYDRCRFLHVSTDEVYGDLTPDAPPSSESAAYAPNSPYAASKASSDHLMRAYYKTYGLPTLISNCSNNFGPYQHPEKLIPLMIVSAVAGKPLPIYGDGLQSRDWLYVEDHCEALRMILAKGQIGQTYNVGGCNERKNIEVVRMICQILDQLRARADGKSYVSQIVHVEDRLGHDRRYAIDAGKISAELGWSPQESFQTGIRKTIEWYLANEEWVNNVMGQPYEEWLTLNYTNRREILTR